MDAASFVVPGQIIHKASAATAGPGTCVWGEHVHAAMSGHVRVDPSSATASILQARRGQVASLPCIGDTVTCRVTRINPRQASVDILCVSDQPLRDPCAALLRREDVWPLDAKGPLEMHKCFRPGDIVLAQVISLGDARAYVLSTCASEHGVVLARSTEGATMRPVSWCEMECPSSNVREPRKVARPRGPPARPAEGQAIE